MAVSVAVTLPVAMFHRYVAPLESPAARVSSGPNATELTTLPAGSVSVGMSLPVVVRVLAGCSWETAAGAAGDRGHALGAEVRGLLCYQVARFGGPPPGRPHARLGARGAASLHSLTGRHAIADAGCVDAGL
jgi:hypothetical protein